MDLKDNLKAEALALGFSFLSVTDCSAPASYTVYQQWLGRGHHAGMAYLANDRSKMMRREPALFVTGCRSILLVVLPFAMTPYDPPHGLIGRVAAYACAVDYHHVIPELLRRLLASLPSSVSGTNLHRVFTDSAPILERDLAQRAGAGYIGKNSCLIRPGEGSYFLLGEAFIETSLEPDAPFTADRCGNCQRCIQTCPTACILPDRTIDANRCISYLTIENRGSIPRELRSLIGNWVFGCDICQQICPWNKFAAQRDSKTVLEYKPELAFPDLLREIQITADEFKLKYQNTPILRAKHRGYLRNIVVALGNSGDENAAAPLEDIVVHHPDAMIRAHACWALGQICTPTARRALAKRATAETDPTVIEEILAALTGSTHQQRNTLPNNA